MRGWICRFSLGLAVALPLVLLSVTVAQARNRLQTKEPPPGECEACHAQTQAAWQTSAHRQALTCAQCHVEAPGMEANPSHPMQDADGPRCVSCHTTGYDPATNTWKADGVGCGACHGPFNANHPQEPMPADRTANVCGKCHTETFSEWKGSKHGQNDLGCVACHDPHTGGLKVKDASALCTTCHDQGSSPVHQTHANFVHEKHHAQKLTCADCHLGQVGGQIGGGHAVRDHSFNVRLGTCNACHERQQHGSVTMITQPGTPEPSPVPTSALDTAGLSGAPEPGNPLGFAALVGVVGLAGGMILAPWLERQYRRLAGRGKEHPA